MFETYIEFDIDVGIVISSEIVQETGSFMHLGFKRIAETTWESACLANCHDKKLHRLELV